FDSFKINEIGPEEEPVANLKPYLQRRKDFKTALLKTGSAPQRYEIETPPQGVEEITYQSGELKLKAWVDKRGVKNNNAPVLIFFHGGFAFGAGDLEECEPFRDAGFIVMTPMLRGENGNPGSFELFYGEVDDAAAACRWMAEQQGVDKNRIYAFGHSVGGGVSALLSLRDDVPIAHSGSSGGIYTDYVMTSWSDIVPFDRNNPEEGRLRLLVGNVKDMQHPHFAYAGKNDTPLISGMNQAKVEGGSNSRLTTGVLPGDHFTSFGPSLIKYLQQVQK
ncbi:MAG: prolyl oligopeptidase family serine peptidase, partial [Planctomycetaceae bacterium]|nr:prolyl oligopeptidase family serine peptidase [Planctomycetaceae bacterium]